MRELDFIAVKIQPSYYTRSGGSEIRELNVTVRYNGMEFNTRENLWHSDAISVLDYCFDRAKNSIKEHIEGGTPKGPDLEG